MVLKEGMSATEEEIINPCKERLASYKKPKSVEFREELPRSPTGKVLKRKIREESWDSRDRGLAMLLIMIFPAIATVLQNLIKY